MPRTARLDTPGLLHHIMIRGIERRKIFSDDKDRENLIKRLSILDGKAEDIPPCGISQAQPASTVLSRVRRPRPGGAASPLRRRSVAPSILATLDS